jgi:hypothetical protein
MSSLVTPTLVVFFGFSLVLAGLVQIICGGRWGSWGVLAASSILIFVPVILALAVTLYSGKSSTLFLSILTVIFFGHFHLAWLLAVVLGLIAGLVICARNPRPANAASDTE